VIYDTVCHDIIDRHHFALDSKVRRYPADVFSVIIYNRDLCERVRHVSEEILLQDCLSLLEVAW
jgi:hypothetical protein